MQEHLALRGMRAEVASLRQTMEMLDEWQAPEPSPYFGVRLRARMREEHAQQSYGWLGWLRRPAVVTAAAALMAVGVGMLGGSHRKDPMNGGTRRDKVAELSLHGAASG